jgi:hypothetical protein
MGFPGRTLLVVGLIAAAYPLQAAKAHTVFLGSGKIVAYSIAGDPSGARPEEKHLRVRPLLVDGKVKEWTTGDSHDITDRSFWVWQRGPWLLIDRTKGNITALRLPDYEPAVSNVIWFRDDAAYCGLSASGRQLYAVVAQVTAHRPLLAKKLSAWTPGENQSPACAPPVWQREPLRVTFQQSGAAAVSYDLVGLSAVLVEDGNGNDAGSEAIDK